MSLSAFIHVYSTEVQKRKLVIRFAATDPALGITPALTIAVNNMSRTPNSRKTKAPSDLAHIPLLGPPQLHTPRPTVAGLAAIAAVSWDAIAPDAAPAAFAAP